MAMMTKIYAICEPDGEIRYIGKTKHPLAKRMIQHLSEARRGRKTHLYNWLRSVLSTGHLPLIQLIGEVAGNGSNEERAWIAYGRAEGWRLVNETDGGEGTIGRIPSKETIRKLSEINKGNHYHSGFHHSEEVRKKMSLAHKPCVFSEETRKKISLANKGRPLSEEHKHKIAEAQLGEKNHAFGKKSPMFGRRHSIETCLKMSVAQKKRMTPEYRKKIGDKQRGKKHSQEVKLKMCESQKKRWQNNSEEARQKMSDLHKGNQYCKGRSLSLEHRKKIGESNIGKRLGYHASLETRKKSSESHKGKPNGCLGTHRSKASRLKMSESRKRFLKNKGMKT